MKVSVIVCFALVISVMANKPAHSSQKSITYKTRNHKEISIPMMVHLDVKLTKKLAKEYSFKTRKKIKNLVRTILKDASMLFRNKHLNQTVNFKLIDIKFIRNKTAVLMDENVSIYLKNYCDWQSVKKKAIKRQYYSVLLTGLDLFYLKNGKAVHGSTARSYTNGVCHLRKSCALIEWRPKLMGYLLAHEIGHSLGIRHDSVGNCENFKGIMETKYDPTNSGNMWSPCSRKSFELFMRSDKAWCLKKPNHNLEYTYVK